MAALGATTGSPLNRMQHHRCFESSLGKEERSLTDFYRPLDCRQYILTNESILDF